MTVTDPAITLQVKDDDEVLEPYSIPVPVTGSSTTTTRPI
jgi:hypothetical protein